MRVSNIVKLILIASVLIISGALGFLLSSYQHQYPILSAEKDEITETLHDPALFVKQIENDPLAGEKIFKEFCSVCHSQNPVIDINAPRIGDQQAWDNRKKQGDSMLLNITIKGIGAMPARGGCFECSDDQLRQAIRYILDNSEHHII
jgi:cytochrome c5